MAGEQTSLHPSEKRRGQTVLPCLKQGIYTHFRNVIFPYVLALPPSPTSSPNEPLPDMIIQSKLID